MFDAPNRWDPSRGHRRLVRVEVWQGTTRVSSDAPIDGGAVTDRWAVGIRRTLSLTVPPSWWRWLQEPCEIRPYVGADWGRSEFVVPMGRFPVDPMGRPTPNEQINITADDWWSRVMLADFERPINSYRGEGVSVITRLIREVGFGSVTTSAASDRSSVTPVLWDKTRHDTIAELCKSLSCEAFFDRLGTPTIQDRLTPRGPDLVDGARGTVVSASSEVDWSKVRNVVCAVSSKAKTDIPPSTASIINPRHFAHPSRIGKRVMRYSSSNLSTPAQVAKAARTILNRRIAPARTWKVTCVPDPTRDAGDQVVVRAGVLGGVMSTITEVVHPLKDGPQSITLGLAAEDDDIGS